MAIHNMRNKWIRNDTSAGQRNNNICNATEEIIETKEFTKIPTHME